MQSSTFFRAPVWHQLQRVVTGVGLWAGLCFMASVNPDFIQAAESAGGKETLPETIQIVSIESFPTAIELADRFGYRQLLITGRTASGETVDLTRMVELTSPGRFVSVSPTGVVRPVVDGEETLVFRFRDQSLPVSVKVNGVEKSRTVSFVQDVQPAFSKMTCNAGTCHGSKDGRNGFKLSLRGYDSLYDHQSLTDDVGARRFNRTAPDQSLMLLKATGSIPHVGGVRTTVEHPYYQIIRQWIAEGAKLDLKAPRVTSITVLPPNPVIPRAGMRQQMVVLATYADGSVRDVTQEAFVESGNIEVISAESTGVLTMLRRGEAPVLVRYEGAYAATTLTVMGDRDGFRWERPETYNYIDEHVYNKLERNKILPSAVCSDDEFVRRVYLDLVGLPPTADQVRQFLADSRPSRVKRDALVDELIGSRAFVELWTNKWADLLQVNRKFLGETGAIALRNWIKDSVATNKPYDQFAYEILTASGSTMDNPAAAYFKVLREPTETMENTTHLFLAIRFNCNKCHDHPFERWTQDQYYHLASYFAQIGRKEDPNFAGQRIGGSAVMGAAPLVEVIYDAGGGEIKHDRTGETAVPAFPYQHDDVAAPNAPRREQIARWIASAKNPYFAASYVNRLWGYLFGIGIIEPIDDIRAGNPPSNPELLSALTADFVEHRFDVQHMLRTICKSRTYQHSVATNRWNEDDEINYSHALPRRLPAEVLYDAIHHVCGASLNLPGVPAGFRAAELPDAGAGDPFLEDFGRPVRESACECERSSSMVLGPVMKLVNGPTVARAIGDPNNEITRLVASTADDEQLITEIFLRVLARKPTPDELALSRETLDQVGAGHESLVAALTAYESQLPAKQAEWERRATTVTQWKTLEAAEVRSTIGSEFKKLEDQSILVSGPNGKGNYVVVAATDLTGLTGVRLELLPDASLPQGGPGRAATNGNFVLSELTLNVASQADPGKSTSVSFSKATADFSQDGWAVAGAIDGNPASGWAVSPQFNQPHTAIFELAENAGGEGGSLLTFTFDQQFPDGTHTLGRFRLSVTNSPRPIGGQQLPADVVAALAVEAGQRSAEQQQVLARYYQSIDGELARLRAAVEKSNEQLKNRRLIGIQDLTWALINTPAFLFNR
jgi:hypothetical protein